MRRGDGAPPRAPRGANRPQSRARRRRSFERHAFAIYPARRADVALQSTNALEMVALHECVQRIEAADDASEHRVAAIEMRIGRVCHEVLASARVRARERHAERAALVAMRVELIADGIRGAAAAVAPMVAVLCHEVRDYAKEASHHRSSDSPQAKENCRP